MIFKVTNAKDRGLDNILKDLNVFESEGIIGAPPKKEKAPKAKKESKGGKKKKKKDDDLELMTSIGVDDDGAFINHENPDITQMMNLLDVDSLMEDRESDDLTVSDPIIQAEKGSYKRRKKDPNEYKKEFAEELTLLYDLLGDTSNISKKIKDQIDFDGKKFGGINKNLTDMINNLMTSQTTRLQIIKEISSIKKTAIDLTLKSEARKEKSSEGENMQHTISGILNGIMKQGRSNFVQSARGSVGYLPQDTYDYDDGDDAINVYASMLGNGPGLTDNDRDDLSDIVADRLREETERMRAEGNTMARTEEADAYIRYENRNVEIKISLCVDTNEWNFFAVDQDGINIADYPLPRKKDVEPVRFTGAMAIDKRGCQYKVVEYYSSDLG